MKISYKSIMWKQSPAAKWQEGEEVIMRPLDFISLSSKMMKAYETVCQPVCKRYQLNQTCLDVILFLANNPEYNTAKDLWEIRGIRSGNASVAIETLVRRGYLKREADAQDRRLQRLILTERANEAIAMGRQAQHAFGEQMMSGITEEELQLYWKISEQIRENVIRIAQGKEKER